MSHYENYGKKEGRARNQSEAEGTTTPSLLDRMTTDETAVAKGDQTLIDAIKGINAQHIIDQWASGGKFIENQRGTKDQLVSALQPQITQGQRMVTPTNISFGGGQNIPFYSGSQRYGINNLNSALPQQYDVGTDLNNVIYGVQGLLNELKKTGGKEVAGLENVYSTTHTPN